MYCAFYENWHYLTFIYMEYLKGGVALSNTSLELSETATPSFNLISS